MLSLCLWSDSIADRIVSRRGKGEFTQLANQSIGLEFGQISELLGSTSRAVQSGVARHRQVAGGSWRRTHRRSDDQGSPTGEVVSDNVNPTLVQREDEPKKKKSA